jgi:hypothetical protein
MRGVDTQILENQVIQNILFWCIHKVSEIALLLLHNCQYTKINYYLHTISHNKCQFLFCFFPILIHFWFELTYSFLSYILHCFF